MAYVLMPGGSVDLMATYGGVTASMPPWQLALANGAIILVVYGASGTLGIRLARGLGLPAVYRPGAGWARWLGLPLMIGLACGAFLVAVDLAAQRFGDFAGVPHPPFPASVVASFTAGVGEEIMFRLFVMCLWLAMLRWVFARLLPGRDTRPAAFWLANAVAALAFTFAHLGTAMAITGAAGPADLPPVLLVELVAINGSLGLVAGAAFARDGLVAAAGVHFWADVVWHVIFGALG
jgi:hypothetical protein